MALSQLVQPIASFSLQKPQFSPWGFIVGFVTDENEALIQVFLYYFGFTVSCIIPPLLLIHSSVIRGMVYGDTETAGARPSTAL
jgi:hypothetical protein